MAERILIWGAGAIGGSVGAWLKRAGHDITFVDVVPKHVAAIRDRGLRIIGPVEEFIVHTPACTPEELTGTWQRVFLAVKAQHTEAATRSLTPHLAQDGHVLSLQNGLNERIIQRIVGRDRTIGRSSISAPTGWRLAKSCSATGAPWCSASSTVR